MNLPNYVTITHKTSSPGEKYQESFRYSEAKIWKTLSPMDIRNTNVIRPRNANKMLTTTGHSARVLSCTALCTLFVSS